MAANPGNIEDIFRRAFESHEMAVSPHVWAGVQSTLAASAASGTATAAGSTFLAKAAAVIGAAAVITAATISEVRYHKQEQALLQAETTAPLDIALKETAAPAEDEAETAKIATEKAETPEEVSAATHETMDEQPVPQPSKDPETNTRSASAERSANVAAVVKAEENASSSGADNQGQTASQDAVTQDNQTDPKQDPVKKADAPEENAAYTAQVPDEEPVAEEPEQRETIASFTHDAKLWISADGDGTNDYFYVEGTDVKEFFIRIYDKGGQLLFESDDINFKWYGTDRSGKRLPSRTVCFYQIDAVGTDGLPYQKRNARGSVTVVY